jgi:hypothetical protein
MFIDRSEYRTHLKKVFYPNLGVGYGFLFLNIQAYACGLKPLPAYIFNQNPFFETGSIAHHPVMTFQDIVVAKKKNK